MLQGGPSTVISVSGSARLRTLNRLWAMTMSPTQDGPTIRTLFMEIAERLRGNCGEIAGRLRGNHSGKGGGWPQSVRRFRRADERVARAAIGTSLFAALRHGQIDFGVRIPKTLAGHGAVQGQISGGYFHPPRGVGLVAVRHMSANPGAPGCGHGLRRKTGVGFFR